jgi:hypothetical protein
LLIPFLFLGVVLFSPMLPTGTNRVELACNP